jgi:MFS family permease
MPEQREPPVRPYAWYVLGLLTLTYVLNFIDRQILSILADDIKRDLHLQDQDIGFLFGTAFGIFFALFGIPLGRLADHWHRVRLLALGMALWSAMTAASGFAASGAQLSIARVGVGVGEASAGPAAYSLLSDWFPKRLRATALAVYSSGIYVGAGLSLFIGGAIVQHWNHAFPGGGPLGLVGWQAAFLAVGAPGLVVALWSLTLREPLRGASEGLAASAHPAPFRAFAGELVAILPPLTLIGAARGGLRTLGLNLGVAALIAAAVAGLVALGEPLLQWSAVGIGGYAVFSWVQTLRRRDAPTYRLTIGTPAFVAVVLAYGLNAFVAYGVSAFAASFARRSFAIPPDQLGAMGLWIGGPAALAGLLGVILGARVADRLRERYATGRIWVVIFGCVAPIPAMLVAFNAPSPPIYYATVALTQFLTCGALGAAAATTQDLVLPRMRGTATAAFFIGTTLIGLALGPYLAGRISTLTGNLGLGVLSLLATAPLQLGAAIAALRWLPQAEATRAARAHAAGEPI